MYLHHMKGRRYESRTTFSRRCVATLALVTFTLGNVGWPLDLGKVGGPKGRCAMTGEARCCCGLERNKSACGCFKAPVLAKTSSCCQKKRAAAEKSAVAVIACDCGDSPAPGFIVSSQPRLAGASVEMPALTESAAVSPRAPVARPNGAISPDTPPPRPSLS